MDDFECDTDHIGQVVRSLDPFTRRDFPFTLEPYSNPLLEEKEDNTNILRENGLIAGGIAFMVYGIGVMFFLAI